MGFVDFARVVADEFHGVGEDALGEEAVGFEVNVLRQFVAVQTLSLPHAVHLRQHHFPYFSVRAYFLERPFDVLRLCQFLQLLSVRSDDGDCEVLMGVSVQKGL